MSEEIKNNKEYELLKAEIVNRMNVQHTLTMGTLTVSIAVLALLFNNDMLKPWMFLIPQMIIIPMSITVKYNREAIAKIAAYMMVFLEYDGDFSWETRNSKMDLIIKNHKTGKAILRNAEFLAMSALCTMLVIVYCCKCYGGLTSWLAVLSFLISMVCTVWELFITKNMSNISTKRKKYVSDWKKIARKEREMNQFMRKNR